MSLLYRETAAAHARGLSQSDFVILADGVVLADVIVATTEELTSIVLDKDHDGIVTEDEVIASEGDLRALMIKGIEVDGDGHSCAAEFKSARLVEGDGLRLEALYRCDARATTFGVTLFFLTELKQHRHVARISSGGTGSATVQKLLGSTDRFLSLELPHAARAARDEGRGSWRPTALAVLTVVFAAWMLGLWVWRYRVTRRVSKKERP